jgi:hypothetical protein
MYMGLTFVKLQDTIVSSRIHTTTFESRKFRKVIEQGQEGTSHLPKSNALCNSVSTRDHRSVGEKSED